MTQAQWDELIYIISLIDLERDLGVENMNSGMGGVGICLLSPTLPSWSPINLVFCTWHSNLQCPFLMDFMEGISTNSLKRYKSINRHISNRKKA